VAAGLYVVLALFAVRAPAAVDWASGPVAERLQSTAVAVRGTDDDAVSSSGSKLQETLGDVGAAFRPSLHQVQYPVPFGKGAEVADMIQDAKDRLAFARHMPEPELSAVVEDAQALFGENRVHLGKLPDDDMGVYNYTKPNVAAGTVKLNDWLKLMGYVVPVDFLTATLIHEAGHHHDGNLATESTLDGEVAAFLPEYEWLAFVDPTGERLGLLRERLKAQMERHPNPITRQALKYAATLDRLVGTGGDKQKIRQYAYEIGYRDGPGGEGPENLAALASGN